MARRSVGIPTTLALIILWCSWFVSVVVAICEAEAQDMVYHTSRVPIYSVSSNRTAPLHATHIANDEKTTPGAIRGSGEILAGRAGATAGVALAASVGYLGRNRP